MRIGVGIVGDDHQQWRGMPESQLVDTVHVDSSFSTELSFERIEGSKLLFENGQSFDTKLFFLEYIAQITSGSGASYFIFSEIDCDSCDANASIYIHSPKDGELNARNGKHSYSFPGREKDLWTDLLIYEGRTLYGQVLENTIGVIWYQKTLLGGAWKNSIFLVDLSRETKRDTFLTGQLKQTLLLLEKGLCKEIPGSEYSSEP